MKHIYLVISQTGTILARIISRLTGDRYAHASLSLDEDLDEMYSFGRIYPRNPFIGGFVKESPRYGTMKRFLNKAKIIVIKLETEDHVYEEMKKFLAEMYENRKMYHYNYKGLFLAGSGVCRRKENCYYCSEFVRDVLAKFHVISIGEFDGIIRPVEFLNIRSGEIVYDGSLSEFAAASLEKRKKIHANQVEDQSSDFELQHG